MEFSWRSESFILGFLICSNFLFGMSVFYNKIPVYLAIRFSIRGIQIAMLLYYFFLCILTTNVAFCMDSGGVPSSSGWTSFEERVLLEPMPSTGESSSGGASINQQPLIPVPQPPLLDENTRQSELTDRLRTNWLGMVYNETILDSFVRSQLEIERNIEAALVADGYSPQVLFEKRDQIRGFIFYPTGRAFSQNTYTDYIAQITHLGTRASVPYKRVIRAIEGYDLFLD